MKVDNFPWWPALTVDPEAYASELEEGHTIQTEEGWVGVACFGTQEFCTVPPQDVIPFDSNDKERMCIEDSNLQKAIAEALQFSDTNQKTGTSEDADALLNSTGNSTDQSTSTNRNSVEVSGISTGEATLQKPRRAYTLEDSDNETDLIGQSSYVENKTISTVMDSELQENEDGSSVQRNPYKDTLIEPDHNITGIASEAESVYTAEVEAPDPTILTGDNIDSRDRKHRDRERHRRKEKRRRKRSKHRSKELKDGITDEIDSSRKASRHKHKKRSVEKGGDLSSVSLSADNIQDHSKRKSTIEYDQEKPPHKEHNTRSHPILSNKTSHRTPIIHTSTAAPTATIHVIQQRILDILHTEPLSIPKLRHELLELTSLEFNLENLRQSRIGVTITHILHHPHCSPLRALARALLLHWVGCLPPEIRSSLRNADNDHHDDPDPHPHDETPTPSPPAKTFHEAMASSFTQHLPPAVAHAVEAALWGAHPAHPHPVFHNLLHALRANPSLRGGLASGALPPDRFVRMTKEELESPEQRAAYAALLGQSSAGSVSRVTAGQVTDLFPCEVCGHGECSFYEQQLRSGDEPATVFLTCLGCKHSFRQEG